MKKVTLFIALICSVSVFSMRYLVQSGVESGAKWRVAGENETLVDFVLLATDFDSWFNETTMTADDEVWVAAGTYLVNAKTNLKDGVDVYGSFVGTETTNTRDKSSNTPWDFTNKTIIDGNTPEGAGFYGFECMTSFVNATVFDGFTITKMRRTGTGNGVVASLWGNITIQNCIVEDNILTTTAASQSGGVYMRTGAALLNSWIHNNSVLLNSGRGGGVASAGQNTVKGCLIENNSAAGAGGAINLQSAGASNSGGGTIENCIIRFNTAGAAGGAVYQLLTQPASAGAGVLLFKNCEITDNTAATGSGALHISGQGSSTTHTLSIEGCTFARNTATAGNGGALTVGANVSTLNYIKNCIFRDNSSIAEGGALYLDKTGVVSNCVFANNNGISTVFVNKATSKIYNNTFANNAGIGLKFAVVPTCEVINNIFWFNTDNVINGGESIVISNNAYNTEADAGAGSISGLTATNTFENPTTFIGVATDASGKTASNEANWKLKSGAPVINAGTTIVDVVNDLSGGARPVGSAYDIGAYEFGAISAIRNISVDNAKISVLNASVFVMSGELSQINVYNVAGMQMFNSKVAANMHQVKLNSGVYIIKVASASGVSTQKIIVN